MKKMTKNLLIGVPVLVVLLAVIAVSCLYWFNSNQYRFRMGALTGEYARNYILDIPDSSRGLDCFLFEEADTGELVNNNLLARFFYDGEKYTAEDAFGQMHNAEGYLDEKVYNALVYYFGLFDGNLVVEKDQIKFLPNGDVLKIENNNFKLIGDMEDKKLPTREFDLVGGSMDLQGRGSFSTDYMAKDPNGGLFPVIMLRNHSIDLEFKNICISSGGKNFYLTFKVSYFNVKFYENYYGSY